MKAPFPLSLELTQECTAEQLGKWCGKSSFWADGVLDAIGGQAHLRPWSPPAEMTPEEEADHLAGFKAGNDLRHLVAQAQTVLVETLFKVTMADMIVPAAKKRLLKNQLRSLVRSPEKVRQYA